MARKEPPRYFLVNARFAGGVRADFERAPWLVEFIPVDQKSALVLAWPRTWTWTLPRPLSRVVKPWRGPLRLEAIRYAIVTGCRRVYFEHEFKGERPVICDGRRIVCRGGNLFLTSPLSLLQQSKGYRGRRGVQFVN